MDCRCSIGCIAGGLWERQLHRRARRRTDVRHRPDHRPGRARSQTVKCDRRGFFIQYPDRIQYEVGAQLIPAVTAAHIHSGAPGVIGTQIVTLFSTTSPISPAGSFTSGSLLAANLPAGVTLESLKTLLASGNAYVDVHTTANPGGELRGQIK